MQQFCAFYFTRLEQLKPAVREAAELEWNERIEFVDNILDLKPGRLTAIIGTLYKEQAKKPNVMADIQGVIEPVNAVDMSLGL